ncbi:MAG TPA: CDP-alcohol phosphatidyltransferase family protein [Methylocella sp.]|nr:CDP-alcohol phosphatidyltransferase family protein [Methylocella sp.]
MPARLAGFLVHCFTACGAALGLAALFAAADGRFPAMFAWLGAAFVIDAVDGTLARRYRVEETVPHIDGAVLDLVVDFLTYVIVPLVALWRSGLLAPPLAVFVCCVVATASALYFADKRMKTHDLWFRGFPAIWNVLVFYLLVLRPGPLAATLIIAAAAFLMFTPVVFVHPLRVVRLRLVTMTVTGAWSAAAIAAVEQGLSQADSFIKAALVAVAVYFLALPLFRNIPFR